MLPYLLVKNEYIENVPAGWLQNTLLTTDTREIVQVLNDHYINIVERSCGEKPTSVAKQSLLTDDIKIVDHIVRHYEDHPSVRHIKKNVKTPQNFTCSLLTISEQEVKKILRELSTEKSAGVDTIPPKLVRLAANYLAGPLSQSINNSIKKGMFPENAKVASVTPIDKKTDDKNSALNFRPISILNCFSKVYESILKTQLVEKMNNLFSLFISAYRESYNTHHMLIILIEEWRKNLVITLLGLFIWTFVYVWTFIWTIVSPMIS